MNKQRGWVWTAAVALLAACGGDAPRTAEGAPAAPPAAVDSGGKAPAATPAGVPLPQGGTVTPRPVAQSAPTRADSAAAAREDVSPEWKQRERSMASYAQCMEQAKGGDAAMRTTLETACSRLPDAPR